MVTGSKMNSEQETHEVRANDGTPKYTWNDTVDYEGRPADKSKTGGWSAVPFIFGAEFSEKTAAFGAQFNLVNYFVGHKYLPLAQSANMVTNYLGTGYLMTLLGGFVADAYIGRFWTIFLAGNIQMIGFVILMLTALLPSLNNQSCSGANKTGCRAVHGTSLSVIYLGLYMISIGTGGIKACVSAFGADQFEAQDPDEAKHLPRYFNVFFGSVELGSLVAATLMVWIQDYKGWDWGYGTLVIIMFTALVLLLSARRRFRYRVFRGSPFTPVARVFVAAFRNRKLPKPLDEKSFYYGPEEKALEITPCTRNFRFLEKAAIRDDGHAGTIGAEPSSWRLATLMEVEDVKMLLRLLPILFTSSFYWTCAVQFSTFTVYQVATMDRNLGSFTVPSGTVGGVFLTLSVMITLVIYDRIGMRVIHHVTGNSSGLSSLRKIGLGAITPIFAMIAAALVEEKRQRVVREVGAEDTPKAILPMSMFWLVPQYLIMGGGQAFIYVGQLEFFYNEAPRNMQSLGTAFVSCAMSIGVFGSSAIVSLINRCTRSGSYSGWLGNNLNRGHLNRFYWLLCILSAINLCIFSLAAWWYQSKFNKPTTSAIVAVDPNTTPTPCASPAAAVIVAADGHSNQK